MIKNLLKSKKWKLKMSIIALVFCFWSNDASAATIGKPNNYLLQSGLVGWWTFDGADMTPNVVDRSGQGNHGYLTSVTSTSSITVSGRRGQALFFDGVNDDMRVPDSTTIDDASGVGQARSWGYWLLKGDGSNNLITDKSSSFSGVSFWSEYTTAQKIRGGVTVTGAVTSPALVSGQWYHVFFTHDGSDTRLYINGTLSAGPTAQTAPADNNDLLYVMGFTTEANSVFGAIDDLRIYNRALSATEVYTLYRLNSGNFSLTPRGTPNEGLNNGLVGHWTFDGKDMTPNVRDRSGQGNHGDLIGQIPTTTIEGKFGQALSFDGVNDYVNCGSNASVLPDTFSFSAWVKTNTTASASALIGLGANAFPYFALHFSTNRPLLYLAASNYRYWSATSPTNLINSDWHHYVVILPGNSSGDINNAVLYVDGRVQDVSFTVNSDAQSSKSLCKLGGYHTAGTFSPLKGVMDDARLYNRVLSASEVTALYQAGSSRVSSTPGSGKTSLSGLNNGLIGHWTFDGKDMGPNIRDVSGQGNHGNLIGQTSTTTTEGKLGQAFYFSVDNKYIRGQSTIAGPGTGEFSLVAWVKIEAAQSYATIVHVGDSTFNHNSQYFGIVRNAGSQFVFSVNSSGGGSRLTHYASFGATSARVIDGRWHLLIGVREGDNLKAYLDGTLVDTYALSAGYNVGSTANNPGIGDSQSLGALATGAIDDVRIYNRALSAAEVLQLYNLGR